MAKAIRDEKGVEKIAVERKEGLQAAARKSIALEERLRKERNKRERDEEKD